MIIARLYNERFSFPTGPQGPQSRLYSSVDWGGGRCKTNVDGTHCSLAIEVYDKQFRRKRCRSGAHRSMGSRYGLRRRFDLVARFCGVHILINVLYRFVGLEETTSTRKARDKVAARPGKWRRTTNHETSP
jgi:hypothetical protein